MDQGNISVQQSDGVAVVTLEGEHDVYTAPSLRDRIDSLIADGVPVVVDMTAAAFIDSSILTVLIAARNGTQEKSLGFAVCLEHDGKESAVQRVFDVARAESLFPILSSCTEAIQQVRSGEDGAG